MPSMRAAWRGFRSASATLLLALALSSPGQQGGKSSISASCLPRCRPSPTSFQIPRGTVARSFAIQSLQAGAACSGEPERIKGFSIRSGGQTVLVFYLRSSGPVSDPVPLENLELPAGTYELLAAPASGASVTLTYSLVTR
jgi:hypothetical protein